MSDWLNRLLVALREARVDLSAEDVADIVWLAPHLDPPGAEPSPEAPKQAKEAEPDRTPAPVDVDVEDEADEEREPTLVPSSGGAHPSGRSRGNLHLPDHSEALRSAGGRPFRAPTGSALPGSLALSRALRPLRRRVPSRTRRVLDLAETIRGIAEEGVWLPALRPSQDRWLDLSMVMDAGPSMGPWRSAATELLALFSSLGAFRSVRVWSLETDSTPIRLRAGLARQGAARRDPRELVDPAGRSLIVILTDCVADSWSDGQVARLVEDWSRSGPVALLQVLPEHIWTRSALGLASAVRLNAPGPAAANARLLCRSTDPWADPLVHEGSPLPVASLTPQALLAWSRVVACAAGAEVPGYRLDLAPNPLPVPPTSTQPPTARERLDRFWSAASPLARRLAGLLAASPAINLPVIRLVRQSLLPEARQVHEAEVLLGGLLRIDHTPSEATPDPEQVRYEFRHGLRSLLLDAVPAADALSVLGGVSSYVEENMAHGVNFQAMLADPSSFAGSIPLDESPFARVAAEVLLRFGGDYARLVKSLLAGQPSVTGQDDVPSAPVGPPVLGNDAPPSTASTQISGLPPTHFFAPYQAEQLEQNLDLLKGRDSEVTILFCDIRGFSRISEKLGPSKTIEWMNDVMEKLSDSVLDHQGVLVDYIGDELMAMWGAPTDQPDHATLACRAALDMIARLPEIAERWMPILGEAFDLGIGLNTGMARVGNVGTARRFKYGPLVLLR